MTEPTNYDSTDTVSIRDRLEEVQKRIAQAAERSGQRMDTITLVAVTKRVEPERVRAAMIAGATDLGENYVQEATAKIDALREASLSKTSLTAKWHFIGHLQSNKARDAVRLFDLIQGVDSARAARAIGRQASEIGKTQSMLIEVNLAPEVDGRPGLLPEKVADVAAEIAETAEGLELRGLMAVAPPGVDPRAAFRQMRRLWDALPTQNRQVLSMGMSNDFETAIEEGATMVRVGSALFGARK